MLEFFAGSGLVSHALKPYYELVWANDICPKKQLVFTANHPNLPFCLNDISEISGRGIPAADLSWASFPCQDLSLAGNAKGIRAERSGLVWQWLRVMDEMAASPNVLVAENVVGLISTHNGKHYIELHNALVERGYNVGAMVLDAIHWVPQSRPRIFIVAVKNSMDLSENLCSKSPSWIHTSAIQKAAENLKNWIWWQLPKPNSRKKRLSDIIDYNLPCHDKAASEKNIALIPKEHLKKLNENELQVYPGYKRMRQGKQFLELRFDNIAGCLRTPTGGSSRQFLVIKSDNGWKTRLLSPREAARLMGAPDIFKLPGNFNDGYRAMGDAVAAPVARFLAKHLLSKLTPII